MLEWTRITSQTGLENITSCLLYSSGTTGLPKGVRLSHWNLMSLNPCTMVVAERHKARLRREGRAFRFRTIAHLPMAHIAGISWYTLNPFYMGGTCYCMKKYDFDSFIEYARQYRPTVQMSGCVPRNNVNFSHKLIVTNNLRCSSYLAPSCKESKGDRSLRFVRGGMHWSGSQ